MRVSFCCRVESKIFSPKSRASDVTRVTKKDLIGIDEYKLCRKDWIKYGVELTKQRRVYIGNYFGATFSSYDLMWIQMMEMIVVEKEFGGTEVII